MSLLDIFIFMGRRGARFKQSEFDTIHHYCSEMYEDGRIVCVYKDGQIDALIFYSMCNFDDIEEYKNKYMFEYAPHNPDGYVCFVEKLIATKWSNEIRREFEKVITTKYPNLEYAIWFRDRKGTDKAVVVKRRQLCTK